MRSESRFLMARCLQAGRELAATTIELSSALRAFSSNFDKEYRRARERDPGLAFAWHLAKRKDPEVGWLDVSAQREEEGVG